MSACGCPPADELGNHPGIVIGAYIAAFLPLTVIYTLDFISEKWETVGKTRSKGHIYLVSSLLPLCFVLYYIHLQRIQKDYKEMAAAMTAAFFCILHIVRTLWGLLQLSEFRKWNIRALSTLNRIGYPAPVFKYSQDVQREQSSQASSSSSSQSTMPEVMLTVSTQESTELTSRPRQKFADALIESSPSVSELEEEPVEEKTWWERFRFTKMLASTASYYLDFSTEIVLPAERNDLSHDELAFAVDNAMVVNSSLLDNEIRGAEIPCRLKILPFLGGLWQSLMSWTRFHASEYLESKDPEECSVQWLVAFLSKFGSDWMANTKPFSMLTEDTFEEAKRNFSMSLGIGTLLHVTELQDEQHRSSVPLVGDLLSATLLTLSPVYSSPKGSMLPFKLNKVDEASIDFEVYRSSIRDGVVSWDRKSVNRLSAKQRTAIECISPVQISVFSYMMDWNSEPVVFAAPHTKEPLFEIVKGENFVGTKTFLEQIGCASEDTRKELFNSIPMTIDRYLHVLWRGEYRNCLLLQASVHVDNWAALESGKRMLRIPESCAKAVSETQKSVFDQQSNLEQKSFEVIVLSQNSPLFESKSWHTRFIGCVSEAVRTFLADWARPHDPISVSEPDWMPKLENETFSFRWSKQLRDVIERSGDDWIENGNCENIHLRLLWEIQSFLHGSVSKLLETGMNSDTLPSFAPLIMLFIVGYPSLTIDTVQRESPTRPKSFPEPVPKEKEIRLNIGRKEKQPNKKSEFATFRVRPVRGPQNLLVECDVEKGSELCHLRIVSDGNEDVNDRFNWQAWKDAFLGRLWAQSEWRSTQLSSKKERLRKETLQSKICSPFIDYSTDLRWWTGWPPFLCHISIFNRQGEIDESRAQLLSIDADMVEYEMNKHIDEGEKEDVEEGEQPEGDLSLEHLLSEAAEARRYNETDHSLELYGKCIGRYGSIDALEEAMFLIRDRAEETPLNDVSIERDQSRYTSLAELEDYVVDARFALDVRTKSSIPSNGIEFVIDGIRIWQNAVVSDPEYCASLAQSSEKKWAGLEELVEYLWKIFNMSKDENCLDVHALCTLNLGVRSVAGSVIRAFARGQSMYYGGTCFAIELLLNFQRTGDPYCQWMATEHFAEREAAYWDFRQVNVGVILEKGVLRGREGHYVNFMDVEYMCFDLKKMVQCFNVPIKDTGDTIFEESEHGVLKNSKAAEQLYKNLLQSRFSPMSVRTDAMNRYGLLLLIGDSDMRDAEKAERLFKQAAKRRNLDALNNLGVLEKIVYLRSQRASRHFRKALSCSEEPSDEDILKEKPSQFTVDGKTYKVWKQSDISQTPHSTAMNNLAVLYETDTSFGESMPKYYEALELYERVLEVDENPVAVYNMAALLKFGAPNVRNVQLADELLGKIHSRMEDLAHMSALMHNVMALQLHKASKRTIQWDVEVEELDNCAVLVKTIRGTGWSRM